MILGSTLFSYTNEWLTGRWTLPDLLRRVAHDGLGPAVEVVGFQAWREFPALGVDQVRAFRTDMDRLGLQAAALGVYADPARRRGQMAGPQEMLDYLRPQLDIACQLGFPVLRMALGTDLGLLESAVPELEARDLTLTLEIQGSAMSDPALLSLLDGTIGLLERLQTPALGLTLDFSLAMTTLPPTLLDHWRAAGMSAPVVEAFESTWRAGGSGADFASATEKLGVTPALIAECAGYLFRFGCATPEQVRPLLPWVRHAHAKFWDLQDAATQVSEQHGAMIDLLVDANYSGAVVSEWGGSAWFDTDQVDAFDVTAQHLRLLRRELHRATAGVPTVTSSSRRAS